MVVPPISHPKMIMFRRKNLMGVLGKPTIFRVHPHLETTNLLLRHLVNLVSQLPRRLTGRHIQTPPELRRELRELPAQAQHFGLGASASVRWVAWRRGQPVGSYKQTKENQRGQTITILYSNNLINLRKIPRNLCFVFVQTLQVTQCWDIDWNKNLQSKKQLISIASVPFFWTRLRLSKPRKKKLRDTAL